MKYSISCPHEADPTLDSKDTYPDYHPLTREEVGTLVRLAQTRKGLPTNPGRLTQALASIQVRLCQAVPGNVCPNEIDGKTAEKQTIINNQFVSFIRAGAPEAGVQKLIDTICSVCEITS